MTKHDNKPNTNLKEQVREQAQQRRGDKGAHDGGKGQSGLAAGTGPAKPKRPDTTGGANNKN